jgi:hypothetical protein
MITALVTLAITVFLAVIILIIAQAIRKGGNAAEEDSKCKAEVLSHAKIAQATSGTSQPTIHCPTKRVVVNVKSEDLAKQAIAEQMKRCWSIWGAGQLDLFGKNEGSYCHVCSMVTVKGVGEVHDFTAYLDEAKATDTLTYTEYLSGERTGSFFNGTEFKDTTPTFTTEQPVAVIFFYGKGLQSSDKFRNMMLGNARVSTAAGGAAGALIGAAAGKAIIVIGTAAGATGVGLPVTAIAWTVGGGITVAGMGAGLLASTHGTASPDTIAAVVARPYTEDGLKDLGCQYDPVSN